MLGLCVAGAGGVGYYFGTVTQGEPVKATVDIEANKSKKTTVKKADQAKTASKDSKTSDKKKEPKAKVKVNKKDHAQVRTYRHHRQTQATNKSAARKPITKKPAKNAGVKRSTFKTSVNKSKTPVKTKKHMYLTGRKTKYSYTPSEIAQANRIYQHHKGLSFAQCLAQAKKGK